MSPPPVLGHPAMPTHQVIIAGDRFPVPLYWPDGVHRRTGTVLLRPPSPTTAGVLGPQPVALRTALTRL
jgi:hypothetical protein